MKCSLFFLVLTIIFLFNNVLTHTVNETKADKGTDKSSEEDNYSQLLQAGRALAKLRLGCKMYNVDPCTSETIEESLKKGNLPKDFFDRLEHTSLRRLHVELKKVNVQSEDRDSTTPKIDTTTKIVEKTNGTRSL